MKKSTSSAWKALRLQGSPWNHGRITAENAPDGGARFVVRVPKSGARQPAPSAP
jgi:hypothetical protein